MMKRTFIRGLFSVVAALFVASATAAGKVEVTGDTSHGTVTSTTEGVLVTVTVTPAEGYYIRKSDITATKAFMPVAAAPRRSSVPVADELTLVGADPEDLSQARTYTITLPGEEYDVLLDVRYFNRNAITESMVSLSETVFVYNGKEQRPTVFVRGLTENKDYTLTYSNLNSQETGEYTVTVKGRSAWSGTITRTYKIFAGGKVEVNNSITGGTIATAIDGLTVTLTVTPADGYYIRKEDIALAKTFMPVAANSRRAIPVADLLTLEGEDPSDLSLPRTYTAQLPGWEYNAYADAVFTMRTNLTDDMVRLSSTEFPYNGTDQKPQVTVRGLTEGVDYLLSFNGSSWSDVGTYSLTVTGRSTWKGTVSKTYSITKVPAVVSQKPEALSLIYTKETQTLVKAGDAIGGTMLYSLDGASFTSSLPSATAANTYTVYYKVQGDANHSDTQPQSVSATIGKKDIVISGIAAQDKVYDGTTAVTLVYDGVVYGGIVEGDVLTVTAEGAFSDADAGADKAVAISHLTLGGASIANYQLAAEGQQTLATATISKAASSMVKVPVALSLTYTGFAQTLAEPGEGAGGVMQYSLSADGPFAEAVPTGTAAGSYTLYYMVQGDGNHLTTAVASISVTIAGKVVDMPVIDLDEPTLVYDGQPKRPSVTVKDGETVIPATEYEVSYESNVNVGDAKVVITDVKGGNYVVSGEAVFSIVKADPVVTTTPKALELDYNGEPQVLISAGEAIGGVLVYSLDGESYDTVLPTAIEPALYTVYYKVIGDDNHLDSEVSTASAVIRPQQLLYASGNEANADIVVDDDGNVNVVINELPEGFFDGTAELPTTLVDENSTEYGVTEVASEAFEDMPSDIIVVLPEGVSTTEGVTNVVNGDGTCETMDLTDIIDFNLPIDVEAENVVYVREVQEETFTVCLPYDCDVPDNATAYVLKDTDEDGLSFEEHDGQLEAYQPYVLTVQQPVETRRRSGGNDSSQTVTLSAMNVVLSCSADEGTIQKNNYILCGSVRSMTHAEGYEKKVYIMQPDYSWRMTASSDPVMAQEQYLAPFQAYLLYTGSEEPQEVSSSFVESVTGIKLTNIHRKVEQDGWYSLEGYKLAAKPTHKGIYLRHGKKIVLK